MMLPILHSIITPSTIYLSSAISSCSKSKGLIMSSKPPRHSFRKLRRSLAFAVFNSLIFSRTSAREALSYQSVHTFSVSLQLSGISSSVRHSSRISVLFSSIALRMMLHFINCSRSLSGLLGTDKLYNICAVSVSVKAAYS